MLLPGLFWVTRLLDDPAALTPHPATTDVEHLHGRLEIVIGERHHVSVGAVAEHHGLLLQRTFERRDVIPQPGGPFEIQLLGGRVHLLFHVAGQPVGLACQEVAEVERRCAGVPRH